MTTFIDINLKAVNEAAMLNALLAAGFRQDSETGAIYPPDSTTSPVTVIVDTPQYVLA